MPRLTQLTTLAVAGTIAALLFSACGDQRTVPLPTLRSPASLINLTWCPVEEGDRVVYAPEAECLLGDDASASRVVSRVAIANRGNRYVHLLDMTRRRPAILNLDQAVPGLTGILVPHAPALLTPLHKPALALLATEREPELHLLDLASGTVLLNGITPLSEPATALQTSPGTNRVAWLLAAERTLVIADIDVVCDGDPDALFHSECTPDVFVTERARFDLPFRPTHLHLDRRGYAWVTLENHPEVLRFAIARNALRTRCDGDTPCVLDTLIADLPELCLTSPLNDGPGDDVTDDFTQVAPPPSTGFPDETDDADGNGEADFPDEADFFGFSADVPTPMNNGEDSGHDEGEGDAGGGDTADGDDADDNGADTSSDDPQDDAPPAALVGNRCAEILGDGSTRPTQLGPLVTTDEGDLLLVIDRYNSELLVFDTIEGELIDINAENRIRRRALGVPFFSGRLTHVLTDKVESTVPVPTGGSVRTVARSAWVSSSIGATWIVELDRRVQRVRSDGEVVSATSQLFRHQNAAPRLATIRSLGCRLPSELERRFERLGVDRCDNRFLPRPEVLAPDRLPSQPSVWTQHDPQAYVVLPHWTRVEFDTREDEIVHTPYPDAWATPGDTWELVWEGVLPSLAGRPIRVASPTATEVRFPGAGVCETDQDLCGDAIDLAQCPAARDLCRAGTDPCEARFELCTQCPEFCRNNDDLCTAGVEVGDRLLIVPLRDPSDDPLPPECTPWLESTQLTGEPPVLEFVIEDVRPDRVRVRPVDGDNVVGSFPPASCIIRPLQATVRTGESWMFSGTRNYRHVSRHVAQDGACVARPDMPDFQSRPELDETWVSFHGLRLGLSSGDEPPTRGFGITFRVDANFTGAAIPSNASVVSGIVARRPGRRNAVVLADDGRNIIRIIDHRTLLSLPPTPLP